MPDSKHKRPKGYDWHDVSELRPNREHSRRGPVPVTVPQSRASKEARAPWLETIQEQGKERESLSQPRVRFAPCDDDGDYRVRDDPRTTRPAQAQIADVDSMGDRRVWAYPPSLFTQHPSDPYSSHRNCRPTGRATSDQMHRNAEYHFDQSDEDTLVGDPDETRLDEDRRRAILAAARRRFEGLGNTQASHPHTTSHPSGRKSYSSGVPASRSRQTERPYRDVLAPSQSSTQSHASYEPFPDDVNDPPFPDPPSWADDLTGPRHWYPGCSDDDGTRRRASLARDRAAYAASVAPHGYSP